MPSDLTDDERAAAVAILYRMIDDAINSAIPEPWDVADRLAGMGLDALLAASWRPAPHPDAISAAEARGRREGIEEAAKDRAIGYSEAMRIVEAGYQAWAEKPHNARWSRRIAGTPIPNDLKVNIAETLARALSSIPPQEAPK